MYDNDEEYEHYCPIIDDNCYNEDMNKCNECIDYIEFVKCIAEGKYAKRN